MTTLGIIIGNRGFFPAELCKEGRSRMLKVLEEEGLKYVVLPVDATPYYGAVVTYEEAKKCAELFKAHREEIDGILVTLPNFGEERGIADTIRLAGLDVPVLVHAYPDDVRKMDLANRRDSFCGKMSACNNLTQYNIAYSLTTLHTVDPEDASFRQDLRDFGGVCRVVKGLRHARFGQVGARPAAFITVRYSEKLLEEAGISVGVHRPVRDLCGQSPSWPTTTPRCVAKLAGDQGLPPNQGHARPRRCSSRPSSAS